MFRTGRKHISNYSGEEPRELIGSAAVEAQCMDGRGIELFWGRKTIDFGVDHHELMTSVVRQGRGHFNAQCDGWSTSRRFIGFGKSALGNST
jgi:hypothetical protein